MKENKLTRKMQVILTRQSINSLIGSKLFKFNSTTVSVQLPFINIINIIFCIKSPF